MPTTSELNQFRRLVGDYGKDLVDDSTIEEYLDDATREVTSDFITPVLEFDTLVFQFHPEVIILAAKNYWWNVASKLVNHHSQQTGATSHQASEKWERAMEMIARLETMYSDVQSLGTDLAVGNLSRFSKTTLTRWGGRSEEDALDT